ncbi:MAG: TMEM14 family protein [Hormoscilla sp.]
MDLGIIAAIGYGVLALVGGIMGYLKVKSKISLISGIATGLLLLVAGGMQLMGMSVGLILAEVITGILIITFGMRLFKTRKFMPAGLMIIAGVVALGAMLSPMFI